MQERVFEIATEKLTFIRVDLIFNPGTSGDVFARKTDKTLKQMLIKKRYKRLTDKIPLRNQDQLIGSALFELKSADNPAYKLFLNKYGDETYCRFYIEEYLSRKGLYAFFADDRLTYIGRTKSSFKERINDNYGRIAPTNCYLHGQTTNCHLNSLINLYRDSVQFYVCPLEDNVAIERLEKRLIWELRPEWNIKGL
jgi:hypothetical protein